MQLSEMHGTFKFNFFLVYIKSNDVISAWLYEDYSLLFYIFAFCCHVYKQGLQGTPPKDFMKIGLRLSMLNGVSTLEKILKSF